MNIDVNDNALNSLKFQSKKVSAAILGPMKSFCGIEKKMQVCFAVEKQTVMYICLFGEAVIVDLVLLAPSLSSSSESLSSCCSLSFTSPSEAQLCVYTERPQSSPSHESNFVRLDSSFGQTTALPCFACLLHILGPLFGATFVTSHQ